MNLLRNKKGAVTTESMITLMILIIIVVAAAIPVTLDIITNLSAGGVNATLTGTTLIVVNLIPLFLGLAALVLTARSMKS